MLGSGISETPRAWASMWAATYSVGDMRGQGVGQGLSYLTLGGFAPRKRLAYLHKVMQNQEISHFLKNVYSPLPLNH